MPTYSKLTIVDRLDKAELALTNATTDAEMAANLAQVKYTAAEMAAGRALLVAARLAHRDVDAEAGEALTATAALTAAHGTTHKAYMKHAKLARAEFEGAAGILEDLGLRGDRAGDQAGWVDQARNFYLSLLAQPALLARMDPYGMDAPALNAGRAAVEAVQAARGAAASEREGSQSATTARRLAMAALDKWMGKFIKVARVVFADQPQRLERLGITVPADR